MLKLTVKPGEFLQIGNEIKVIFTGGSANNMRVMIDAPRSYSVVRSKALEKKGDTFALEMKEKYYKDKIISQEAADKIKAILMEERRKSEKESINDKRIRKAT